MGDCSFCGEDAGFLRSSHSECRRTHREALRRIEQLVEQQTETVQQCVEQIVATAESGWVDRGKLVDALSRGWTNSVRQNLEKDGVSFEQQERLDSLLSSFSLTRTGIDRRRLWDKVVSRRHKDAKQEISQLIEYAAQLSSDSASDEQLFDVKDKIEQAAKDVDLPDADLENQITLSVGSEVDKVLEDHILTEEEEASIAALLSLFSQSSTELAASGASERLEKAKLIRRVMGGEELPDRRDEYTHLPFRLMKSESLLWVFDGVDYHKETTKREFVGGSRGASFRVARGVYVRTGQFRGRSVERQENVHVDTGQLGITTKHIYFAGPRTSFRIRHSRVVSMQPFSDGIGVMRDTASAKPESFVLGDGWFAYNLINSIPVE
ncbi:MAG: hypothetical protein OXG24_10945 [Gammaproteobacteria bacterium]|nr:hypothetical protein [Gammaproteobacteria bacterium]